MPRGQLVEGDGSHGASSKKGGVLERQSFCRSITGKAVAALCAVGLCLAGALAIHGAQQAQAVDLHADNKLTITYDNGPSDLVYDIYFVAKAVEQSGADAFTFDAVAPFTDLTQQVKNLYTTGEEADYDSLVAAAAELVRAGSLAPMATIANGETKEGLPAGLYLALAHNKGQTNYFVGSGNSIRTVALTSSQEFTFKPQLISIPTKESGTTAGADEWIYSVEAQPKADVKARFGSLRIVKDLLTYETSSNATFVFNVDVKVNGSVYLSNVYTINFSEAGKDSVTIDNLPVGAEVTVTESYSGANYSAVAGDETEKTTTIYAGQTSEVVFTNDYNESGSGGGAVVNTFEAVPDSQTGTRWQWSRDGEVQQ